MTLQVLISTMNQKDYSLLEKMNIQSDAIVINQCEKNEITEFGFKGNKIIWISLAEKGVGLSRNTALMRATADIVLFADDDVVYKDGYKEEVLKKFDLNPKADILFFNLISLNPMRQESLDTKEHKLNYFNSLRYGACRIAARRNVLLKKNIYFSLLFGGGARYQAGEDSLFITEALKKGCYLFATDSLIGTVAQETSTWFKGFDWYYYKDRGALFYAMYGKLTLIMLTLFEIRRVIMNKKIDGLPLISRIKAQLTGIKEFKKEI